jgi:CDP-paratose 2-epimerase
MKVLITGGAGFVGSNLAIFLKKKYPNYSIITFDNLKRRGSELNMLAFKELGILFIHGDIRNPEDLEVIPAFDVMIEASAEPSVLAGIDSNPFSVINNNLIGSIHCFNTAIKNKAKLIFLSTSRVYPIDKIENANFEETDLRFDFSKNQEESGISEYGISEELNLMTARSFYGSTKLASELFLNEYNEFYNLESTITRYGVIAGPRQMGKTDQGIVTLWMAKHYYNQSLKYIGYGGLGKQVRDILHIDDLLDLVDYQIHNFEKFKSKLYNVGGGIASSLSLLEMTNLCEEITGNKIQIDKEPTTRPADLRVFITDARKIERETGWKPKKTTRQIFEDVYNWIYKNEKDLNDILR